MLGYDHVNRQMKSISDVMRHHSHRNTFMHFFVPHLACVCLARLHKLVQHSNVKNRRLFPRNVMQLRLKIF